MMRATNQAGRAAWPSGDDDTLFVLLVLFVGGGLLGWLAWDAWRVEISAAAIDVFRAQIAVLRHWTDRFDLADRQMAAANPALVTLRDLVAMARAIGEAVAWPAAGVLALLAILCAFGGTGARYRRRLDLDALAVEQAASFPTVAAFVRRRLRLTVPAASPRPTDPALTPTEWVACHATGRDGGFDRDAARLALTRQLGSAWTSPAAAAPHERVLLAGFALHLVQRRGEAMALLGQVSVGLAGRRTASVPEGLLAIPERPVAGADALLRDPLIAAPLSRLRAAHAFTPTALMGLLVDARRGAGVLPPAAFVWLRLVDRPLWHALASLGFEADVPGRYLHPNPRVEAAGVRDHWATERLLGHALPEPHVNRALAAIEAAIRNTAAQPAAPTSSGDLP